jgi:hypothetical protein
LVKARTGNSGALRINYQQSNRREIKLEADHILIRVLLDTLKH